MAHKFEPPDELLWENRMYDDTIFTRLYPALSEFLRQGNSEQQRGLVEHSERDCKTDRYK